MDGAQKQIGAVAQTIESSGITVIIPTLNRPSLLEAKASLEKQTLKADKIIIVEGLGDPLNKFRRTLPDVKTEYVALGDDDIIYPERWLESMMEVMKSDPSIGFVGGTMLPMSQIKPASESEKTIAKVLGSFFGTTNMSQRVKIKDRIEERDETNMVGAGLVRTTLAKEILSDQKIAPAFHDTWMIHSIQKAGYKTMYSPKAFFYHATRHNLLSFMSQMVRCGSGRMEYFKANPREMVKKPYILGPLVFDIYLILFFTLNSLNVFTISGLPFILYILILMVVVFWQKGNWKLGLYYFAMHISYGLGQLSGLIRSVKTWD